MRGLRSAWLGKYGTNGKSMMRWCLGLCFSLFALVPVWAEAVWHCSRSGQGVVSETEPKNASESFSIASIGNASDTIGISIRDLMDVYSAIDVRVSGLPLSACFFPSNDSLTNSAIKSLGLEPNVISALARKSAIAQSHLFRVTDEAQMMRCISKNFPAVGYLSTEQTTDRIAPCF